MSMYDPAFMLRVVILSGATRYVADKEQFVAHCFEWFVRQSPLACKESMDHLWYCEQAHKCLVTAGVDNPDVRRALFFMDKRYLSRFVRFK